MFFVGVYAVHFVISPNILFHWCFFVFRDSIFVTYCIYFVYSIYCLLSSCIVCLSGLFYLLSRMFCCSFYIVFLSNLDCVVCYSNYVVCYPDCVVYYPDCVVCRSELCMFSSMRIALFVNSDFFVFGIHILLLVLFVYLNYVICYLYFIFFL